MPAMSVLADLLKRQLLPSSFLSLVLPYHLPRSWIFRSSFAFSSLTSLAIRPHQAINHQAASPSDHTSQDVLCLPKGPPATSWHHPYLRSSDQQLRSAIDLVKPAADLDASAAEYDVPAASLAMPATGLYTAPAYSAEMECVRQFHVDAMS